MHGVTNSPWRDPLVLEELYIERGLSMSEVADELGCGKSTVKKWMDSHGIEARQQVEPDELRSESWLRDRYVESGETTVDIADELDCHPTTVNRWLQRCGIEHRHNSESFTPKGPDSPHWQGGHRDYGPGWTERKREKVRTRDDRECVGCGKSESDHLDEGGEKLHVHHIKKAEDFDDPVGRNSMENLVALCRSCHYEWDELSPLRPAVVTLEKAT